VSQIGSKLENLFFNKHPFARNGLRAGCRGGPATDERTRSRGCGQDPACKGDEVHRISQRCEIATRVSPGAQLAHTESAAAAGCRKQVRLPGRKLRQLVQIQIGYEP
jgi:hypothetical protein